MIEKKKIKVLRIQSRICVGGPAIHSELLSKYLDQNRFETILVGGALETGEKSRISLLREQGIPVTTIPEMGRALSFWRDFKAMIKLYRFIRQVKPDIVHTHTAKAGAVGRLAAWLAGVPVIIHTFHGHVFRGYFGFLKTQFFILMERLLARISSQIVVISPAQFKDIVEIFKIAPGNKTSIIPLGFELDRFLSLRKNNSLRNWLNLPDDVFLLGIIGRLVPIKNHLLAIQALKRLLQTGVPAYLCVVGDGELRAKLERHVNQYGLGAFVHFLGWRLDIENIYAGIDALLLTSQNEGTPVAIIEAMASGVPVVATNVGGVGDLIQDQITGMLCPPNDFDSLVTKIRQIFESNPLRERLTVNAKSLVSGIYAYKRLVTDIETLYLFLLNGLEAKSLKKFENNTIYK